MRGLLLLLVVLPAVPLACYRSFEGSEAPLDAGGPSATDGAADAADGAVVPPPGCVPKFANDFAGCVCAGQGEIRDCTHGKTGSTSACRAGSQTCTSGRWSECVGATNPMPAETCFDDVDDDCDGRNDNACPGSDDVELCGVAPVGTPLVVSDKAFYGKTDTAHLFVLWNAVVERVDVMRADGTGCTTAYAKGAVSPGKSCSAMGWHAFHIAAPVTSVLGPMSPPAQVSLDLLVNTMPGPPCVSPQKTVRVSIDVRF